MIEPRIESARHQMKVLQVLNDREVVISGGEHEGIEVDDTLRIFAKPVSVVDPDTGEFLGEIVRAKAVVRVFDVQDRFCLARTFRTRKVNVGGTGPTGFGSLFDAPKYETRTETLRRDPSKEGMLPLNESVIEPGDPVDKFEGDTEDVPSASVWK